MAGPDESHPVFRHAFGARGQGMALTAKTVNVVVVVGRFAFNDLVRDHVQSQDDYDRPSCQHPGADHLTEVLTHREALHADTQEEAQVQPTGTHGNCEPYAFDRPLPHGVSGTLQLRAPFDDVGSGDHRKHACAHSTSSNPDICPRRLFPINFSIRVREQGCHHEDLDEKARHNTRRLVLGLASRLHPLGLHFDPFRRPRIRRIYSRRN
mmetsp:Transcript_101506/g.293747  ORF Transcript_101506/g.293747 Transcript_101506/m.293747 type:complete len:209 (+) Transcript_101506:633-1259(+)